MTRNFILTRGWELNSMTHIKPLTDILKKDMQYLHWRPMIMTSLMTTLIQFIHGQSFPRFMESLRMWKIQQKVTKRMESLRMNLIRTGIR